MKTTPISFAGPMVPLPRRVVSDLLDKTGIADLKARGDGLLISFDPDDPAVTTQHVALYLKRRRPNATWKVSRRGWDIAVWRTE